MASAEASPPHVTSVLDKEQRLKEAQRLFEEGMELRHEGRYKEAENPLEQALRIRKELLGPEHVGVAACLNQLGAVYSQLAHYEQGEVLFRRALRILEVALGPNNTNVAVALSNLAGVYMDHGQYDRAEPLALRALRIQEATLGPNHLKVAHILDNLAELHRRRGQYDRAEPLALRALRIEETALGPDHTDVALSLNNLANAYKEQGRYNRAEPLALRALRIQEATLGANHPEVARSMANLAGLYAAQGHYDRAEPLNQRALSLFEAALGPRHPLVAYSLGNLASFYAEQGHYDRAKPLAQRALRIFEAALGPNHPEVAYPLHNLATLLSLQRKLPQALQHQQMAFARDEQWLRSQGLILSDDAFASLLTSLRVREEELSSMLLQNPKDQTLARLALSVTLLRKGRTADEAAQFTRVVYRNLSEPDRLIFDSLRALRSRFSSLSLAGPGKMDPADYRKELADLDSQANAMEEDLARRSAPLRARRNLPGISNVVEQVAMQLPKEAVLVELVVFHRRDFHLPEAKQPNELRYLAFILGPNRRVTAIDLGLAKRIEDAVEQLHAAVSNPSASYEGASRELFDKLMKPLLPALGSAKRLILSLDGQLQLIPFDVLHDGKGLLGDRFQISYVSSGRDLLPRDLGREPATEMVIFADPDFGARISAPNKEALALGTNRGQRGLRPAYLDPLPGARKEAEALKQLVPSARLLLGEQATEPALLGLSAPGILHIATHGLFADDPSSVNRSRSGHSHFEEETAPPSNHPLLRSALALAGAMAYQAPAEAATPDRPDGLVTALELAGMNLWGTQLVVLSACNTGRGSVQMGQGVYGLRRALITAGAETLVTSLWKVNDEATKELMTGYYQRLRQGEGRTEAMQHAAWEMRKERSHPYYWASFVVIGRGEPLRGTW